MEDTPRSGLTIDEWVAEFLQAAEASIRNQLSSNSDHGTLRHLTLEHRGDGIWAIATFSMDTHPGVTFIRSQNIVPDLSGDWEAAFAATLFDTHLIEWFYAEAKNTPPDPHGIVRN